MVCPVSNFLTGVYLDAVLYSLAQMLDYQQGWWRRTETRGSGCTVRGLTRWRNGTKTIKKRPMRTREPGGRPTELG